MARYDKIEPNVGSFRAPVAVDWPLTDAFTPFGVGVNSAGRLVRGVGVTAIGIVGVCIAHKAQVTGKPLDTMTTGEIVEFGGTPGTVYTANTTTGVISATAPSATQVQVGFTVEGDRLLVGKDV